MPDRSSDLPPLSIASVHLQRPSDDQLQRIALLDATVLHWLRDAGWSQSSASASSHGLMPTLVQWLEETPPERWFDLLPMLADRLSAIDCRNLARSRRSYSAMPSPTAS